MFREKLLEGAHALTFNDVVLLPRFTQVEPMEIDVSTCFTKKLELNIPFVSSPMDTVTGAEMAIALAREGGIGILHRNCAREEQVEMAKKVKRAEAWIIRDVITISPEATIEEAIRLMEEKEIHGLPVVRGEGLIGIITWRDVRFADRDRKVEELMTKEVITAREGVSIEEAKRLLHEHRIEKLPIVDEEGRLKGLITVKDIEGRKKYPSAVRDEEGRLLVGAAISPFDSERAKALDPLVDALVIDVAHFHNEKCIQATKKLLKEVSSEVVIGNIGTYEAAIDCIHRLEEFGAFRVGLGSGSACITSVVTKVAAPTLFAVASVADACREEKFDVPIIADGGVRNPGDVALALAAGASCAMMGNVFAGCKESPGKLIAIEGKYYKEYYGMGSHAARKKRLMLDRYSFPSKDIAEGVEGWVPYRGSVQDVVKEFVAGLRAAMGYVGAKNIKEMWEKARFALISEAGGAELKPHDIFLPKS